jgi:hypothetical protein
MIDQRLVDRADELIRKGEAVLSTARPSQSSRRNPQHYGGIIDASSRVDFALWSEWRNQSLSFLQRTLGDADTYSVQFAAYCTGTTISDANGGLGILRAVKQDLEGGHLARLPELVRGNVFSDFLEMAEHLLSTHYKDAAAVLGGGVLEEHLRLLCKKNGVETMFESKPKKADAMNAELAKAGVYTANRQKIITGWLGTRNSAAHAEYERYSEGDVEQLLAGLREFVDNYPA